jgi:hypothetical protein
MAHASCLLVHERTSADGASERTWLELLDQALFLRIDQAFSAKVELSILEAVMRRYGRPLADDVVAAGPTLELEGKRTLCLFRHRARYDVIARDFLVYAAPGQETLVELAASVTAALVYLVSPTVTPVSGLSRD